MSKNKYTFDWADLAFAGKKPLKSLRATFIAAPRELSSARFTQLIKEYLPKGNIIIGLAKEDFVDGFKGQPHFKTLKLASIQKIIDKVNQSKLPHSIYTLHYFQHEVPHIVEKLTVKRVVLVNGSWQHVLHSKPLFYTLVQHAIPYQLVSPFCDEAEALQYESRLRPALKALTSQIPEEMSDKDAMQCATKVAQQSYDYTFQTGLLLAKKAGKQYKPLLFAHNKVVPYETFALHHGASREKYFSPIGDLNHYDAIHAEVELLLKAQKKAVSLKGTTLFINLLPCPTCARMFCDSDIGEFVYTQDHSQGYAVALLEKAGKIVRRITRL